MCPVADGGQSELVWQRRAAIARSQIGRLVIIGAPAVPGGDDQRSLIARIQKGWRKPFRKVRKSSILTASRCFYSI
jgi:hypothetical protein